MVPCCNSGLVIMPVLVSPACELLWCFSSLVIMPVLGTLVGEWMSSFTKNSSLLIMSVHDSLESEWCLATILPC